MVKVDVTYTGDLHCDATHGPSRSKISTDAPTDNKGKGAAFSPTDLVATALATCMTTTAGIKARKLWFVPKRAARVREIGLGEVLIVRVRIIDVIGLKTCPQTFV